MAKKKKDELSYPHPWQGVGLILEGAKRAMIVWIILTVALVLSTIGFAVAWLLS